MSTSLLLVILYSSMLLPRESLEFISLFGIGLIIFDMSQVAVNPPYHRAWQCLNLGLIPAISILPLVPIASYPIALLLTVVARYLVFQRQLSP